MQPTNYTYDGDNNLLTLSAVEPGGGAETTRYVYGVTTVTGSAINSNDILSSVQNPDPTTGQPSSSQQEVYTVDALGETTTLNQLFHIIQNTLRGLNPSLPPQKPIYRDFRPGDVRHSHAAIDKAQRLLSYAPSHRIQEGLALAMDWYRQKLAGPIGPSRKPSEISLTQPAMMS